MKPMPGYIMVDATGLDVSDTQAQTVTGLHGRLTAALATGKQVLLTGMVNSNALYSPVPIACLPGTAITIAMPGFTATVASTDVVTPVSDEDEPTP